MNDIVETAYGYDEHDDDYESDGSDKIKKFAMIGGGVVGVIVLIVVVFMLFRSVGGSNAPVESEAAQSTQSQQQAPDSTNAPQSVGDGVFGPTADGWEGITPPDEVKERLERDKALAQQNAQSNANAGDPFGGQGEQSTATNAGDNYTYVKPKTTLDSNADTISLKVTAGNYGKALYSGNGEMVGLMLSKRCSLPAEEVQAYANKFKSVVGDKFDSSKLDIKISEPRLGISYVRYTPNGDESLGQEVYFLWDTSEGKWVMDSCNN